MRCGTVAAFFLGGTALAISLGCGNAVKPMPKEFGPVLPVQGKVTLGGKPLGGGNVTFHPLEREEAVLQPHGVIDTQGNYFVSSYQQKGAPAGKYRVTVDPGSDDKQMDLAVDIKYQDSERSPLILTVRENAPAGAYDLKMDMNRKR